MSAINGDKSRHQINRKRTVVRRMKVRKMLAERGQTAAGAGTSAAGDRRPQEKSR